METKIDKLKRLGVDLYVVAVGADAASSHAWKEHIGADHYIEISNTAELVSVYHRIFSSILGLSTVEAVRLTQGSIKEFAFDPVTEDLVLTFLKDRANARIEINGLEGLNSLVQRRGGGGAVHEVVTVKNPPVEGHWRVKSLDGDSLLLLAKKPAQLVIDEPQGPRAASSGLGIIASIVRNGRRVSVEGLRVISRSPPQPLSVAELQNWSSHPMAAIDCRTQGIHHPVFTPFRLKES